MDLLNASLFQSPENQYIEILRYNNYDVAQFIYWLPIPPGEG